MPPHGTVEQVALGVRRVIAPNPSPFTLWGTNSFIVGAGDVAVIDPGPDLPEHVAALIAATAGERVTAIIVTHSHRDHSPAARELSRATGAPILGGPPILFDPNAPKADAGFDADYRPDRVLADGQQVTGEGWTLEAVATPGHTSNHLCFALAGTGILFSGDHVMGWATTVVIPPDGDMGAYMASLDRLLARDDARYLPAHGPAVESPKRLVRGQLGHRKHREGQILRLLRDGATDVPSLVERMYVGLDERLIGAAGLSVRAHLNDLDRRGRVQAMGDRWQVAA